MANFTRLSIPQIYIGASTDTKPGLTINSLATLAEALDDAETGVDVSDGTKYTIGQTIIIDAEKMTITGIATNTLTVVRGAHGTVKAAHLNGAAISFPCYVETGSRCYETDTGDWYMTIDGGATWVADRRNIDG